MKKIIGIVLIVVLAGGLYYLYQMDEQDKQEMEAMRKSMEQARATARVQAKAKFAEDVRAEFANCQTALEKSKNDYMQQHGKPIRNKPGEFKLSKADTDALSKQQADGAAACQQAHDDRLKKGM